MNPDEQTQPVNPIVELLRQIRLKIYDRMESGDLNYSREIFTLNKHLQIAQELKDPRVVIQTHNLIGVVESRLGNFTRALDHLQQAYQIAAGVADLGLMSVVQNNTGEVYRHLGMYQEAIAAYEAALPLAKQAHDHPKFILTYSNLGLAWLALPDYQAAENCFHDVFLLAAEQTWMHLPALIQAYSGMADVALMAGDVPAAIDFAAEAERLSRERDEKLLLAQAYVAQAHVALHNPHYPHAAAVYYKQARTLLRLSGMPLSLLARTLIDEARYQQQAQPEDAISLAKEALDLFTQMGLQAERQDVERFLAPLAGQNT